MNISRISCRPLLRITGLLLIIGVLGFVLVRFLPGIGVAAPNDIIVTLTASCNLYSGSSRVLDLMITEPTGEVCSCWNDTTAIGGWMSCSTDQQQYNLADAMDGYYYIQVLVPSGSSVIGDTSILCQVTVLLYEGTSNETIIAYGPFMFTETWTEVGCFKMPEAIEVSWGDIVEGGGCFIATAAYETSFAEEVKTLSRFRDEFLLKNTFGRFFVKTYCRISPRIARSIKNTPWLRGLVRLHLKPVVLIANLFVSDDTN